jgi:hypothetical protein
MDSRKQSLEDIIRNKQIKTVFQPIIPAINFTGSFNNDHTLSQMPYEDEYSQLTSYEDHTY